MWILAIVGCVTEGNGVVIPPPETPQPGEGWESEVPVGSDADDPAPAPDLSEYDNATLRIVSPAPGADAPLGSTIQFEAELLSEDGAPLDADRIVWSSSLDPAWDGIGAAFGSQLVVGSHDIIASAELPNGDTLTYTSGGVRVQSPLAGTYSGFFSATGTAQGFTFTCSGSSLLRSTADAEAVTGEGGCVTSLVVFDLPLDFVFDLDADPTTGALTGLASIQLFGAIDYDFAATGTLTPDSLDLSWNGTVLLLEFDVAATLEADRVSDDPG